MSNVVLIAGVSRFLGGRLAAQLAADPSIDRVIGVDSAPPKPSELHRLGRTEFIRADIRNPLLAKVMAQTRVTTVVHTALLASPRLAGGRVPMQEMNVIGTMQLLAACQKSETVRRVVLKSSASVYGCGPNAPAVLTEGMSPVVRARSGFAKDAVEVEGYLRGFARRRPDIVTTVLRVANLMGADVDSAFTRYLAMPVVPTPLGYDARLQLLHESDAVEVLRQSTLDDRPGTFNVAADGVLTLAQAIRRAGRVPLPVPPRAIRAVGGLVRNVGVAEFTAEEARYLTYGRVLDTTALHERFGYVPRYTTGQALDDFLSRRPTRRPVLGAVAALRGA